jgi:hypothetical protein
VAIFAAVAVLLLGAALTAGGIGPWVARPLGGPGPPPTRPPATRSRPSVSIGADRPLDGSGNGPAGWGIRLVVIAVLALLAVLLGRWLFGRFRELAGRRTTRPGDLLDTGQTMGVQQPPPVREREAGRNFDPRQAADAIISCWLWVERAAAASGSARHEQDTPTEFIQRFTEDRSAPAGIAVRAAAAELLPLYQRARFDHSALDQNAATRARAAAEVLCAPVRRAGGFIDESAGQPADEHTDRAADR